MAKWNGKDRFSTDKNYWEWDYGVSPREIWNSFRPASSRYLSKCDMWEKFLFKSQFSASSWAGLSESGHHSIISTSSLGDQSSINSSKSDRRRRFASCLTPESTPRSQSSQQFEMQAALEASSIKRTELMQKLQEVHGHLDIQTDLLKTKDTQLQQSLNTIQLLELKHKQTTMALSVLKEQRKAAEPSPFEESCQWTELQDKMLQLEMDILKMKSILECTSTVQTSASKSNTQLSRNMPGTKDDFFRERQKKDEREIKKLKEALSEAEDEANKLNADRDHVLKQLSFCKEDQQKILNQVEEWKQRLNISMLVQNELQDQLSETQRSHDQLQMEKELLSTKTLQLEDNIEDRKVKLATALADKDRLLQEKSELHQRIQSLELQLQRSQLGREGYTQQVCELHSELTQAKSQVSQQQQNTLLMKEELRSAKEVNDKLAADLTTATERLKLSLQQLHDLEAEKLIHINQIAALENERLQLISEKEELVDVFDPGDQEELRKLREKCCQLRELQETVENEKKELEMHCQGLEKKVQNVEAEYELKDQQLQCMKAKMEQEKEELKRVAAHWNEQWLDVAMKLQSTQAQLDETKKQQQETGPLRKEKAETAIKVKTLEVEVKDSHDLIESLLEEKMHLETELTRIKREAGVLQQVELDACRQQVGLELNRSQTLQQSLMGISETDEELVQLKAELQKVLNMLKCRDSELELQQQELQSASSKVTQVEREVQRLEQQLAKKDQELKEMDLATQDLMRQRETAKTEDQIKDSALENELAVLTHLKTGQKLDTYEQHSLNTQLDVTKSRNSAELLKQESDQGKEEHKIPIMNRTNKSARSDRINPDQQRKLVTDQLKSLFKDKEEMPDRVFTVIQRKSGFKSPKVIKAMDMDNSGHKMRQDCKPDFGVHAKADAKVPPE